jgi:hypothetical protein
MLFKGTEQTKHSLIHEEEEKDGDGIRKMCLLFNDTTEAFQFLMIRMRWSEVVNAEQNSV